MKWDVSGKDLNGEKREIIIHADDRESAKKQMEDQGYSDVEALGHHNTRLRRNRKKKDILFTKVISGGTVFLSIIIVFLSVWGVQSCSNFFLSSSGNYSPPPQYTSQEEQDARDVLSRQGFEGEELEKVLDLSKKMHKLQNEED